MSKTFGFALAVGLLLVSSSGLSARASSDDNAAISALYKQFATAFAHKDLNGIMSLFTRGQGLFVFDLGTPREHVGWNDYRADWKDFFGSIQGYPAFSIGELGITVSGDVAYTHSIQTFTGKMGKMGRTTLVARVTDVLRKMDGKWLIVQEHVSFPVDFKTMKPDTLSRP